MIKIANAPCSWGVLEFDLEGEAQGYVEVLDEMRETGYVGTELGDWDFMPTDPAALQAELRQRQLDMLGAFVPVALAEADKHAAGLDYARKVAALMKNAGHPHAFIVLADDNGTIPVRTQNAGRITPIQGLDGPHWQIFAEGANYIARNIFAEFGLRTVFHHHCAGYIETPDELTQLMSLTDPEVLGLCFDTGHYAFGGGDPLAGLQQHWDRIWHVHFKDYDAGVGAQAARNNWDYFQAVGAGVFCELGKGNVDFPAVVQFLHQQQYNGWIVVEQDVLPGMGQPKVFAQHNRDYLKSLGL